MICFDSICDEEENRDYLIEHWFLVPDTENEFERVKKLLAYYPSLNDTSRGINIYSIFTTTKCNARCFYCYENKHKREDMTLETADNVEKFMVEHRKNEKLILTWYGGEPLLNVGIIDYICERLGKLGIEFESEMHSNLYLLDENMVKRAVDSWHLNIARLTIDGMNEIYKKTKNYIDCSKNPLARVVDNIDMLLDKGIRIQIRLHLDEYNYSDIEQLVDFLCEQYAYNPLVEVYIYLLYSRHEFNPVNHSECKRINYLKYSDELEKTCG